MWSVRISSVHMLCLWICTISNTAAHSPDKCFIIHIALVLFLLPPWWIEFSRENKYGRSTRSSVFFFSFFFFISPSPSFDEICWEQWHTLATCYQTWPPQEGDPNLPWRLLTASQSTYGLKVCLRQLTLILLRCLAHMFILFNQSQHASIWKSRTITVKLKVN